MTKTNNIGTATATLAELRQAAGLTREDLARKLQISKVAVGKWETGDAYPSMDLILELGDALGVTDYQAFLRMLRRTRRGAL